VSILRRTSDEERRRLKRKALTRVSVELGGCSSVSLSENFLKADILHNGDTEETKKVCVSKTRRVRNGERR